MGQWGVRSDECDEASDALDAGFERVQGSEYEKLMDDRCPLSVDQVQKKLANPATLTASIAILSDEFGNDFAKWDEVARLAFAGVVVRHAEFGVPLPEEMRQQALDWLEREDLDWEDEANARDRRRRAEIELLRSLAG